MQARQTPSQAVKGVEFTTLCKPSHSGKPSYGLYNLPRIMTAATTRGSTTVLDRIAYKKDAASHGIQSFHDGLKPDVPLCVRVSASRDVGARRGSLCEQPTRDGAWRPVPRPRTIHISKKERNTTEDQMSRVAVSCPRKLPEEGAEGEPVNTRSEQPKNECANPSKDRVKHKTAPNKTPAATGERKGVEGIAEEHCSLAQQATRASETTVLKTPIVENNADSIEADKIDVYSMLLEIKCDSSATYDVPTLLSASLTKEAEKTEIFYNENHCDESAAIIARKDELVFRETALNHYLDVSEREHAGSEAVKPVCNYELLGGKAVELNGVCASVVEDSPLPYATSRIAGKPDRLLYTEIVVATVVSLTCLVWIAAVFPVRRLELTRILHIKTGNATEPSFIALTFQTFWYSTVSEITTTSTSKASSRSYYCSSHFCLKEAAYVKSVIGKDASPCDNFYEYACSKWESKTPLSAMGLGVSTSVDTVIDEYMSSDLRDYILQKKNGGANSARFLYKACMSSYRHTSAFLKAKIFSALPVKTWPFNGTIDPLEIWRTAGIMARKYGVPALLNVVAGIERATNNSIVEVTLPRPLFFNGDESRPNVKHMFRNAIREAATEFNYTTMAANLTAQIMEVFKGIAMVSDQPAASRTCRVRKLKHIDHSVRTFITSVFNGDINPNTTVVVGNSDVVLGGLVRLTHNLSAQDFLNYLGFRLLVRLAVLLPEHLVNIRRLFSVEFTGRVVRDDLKWLLCMRLAVAVAPACLENLQAKMFAETRAPTLARWFWLLQVEDFFSRNLRLCAWISEKTLSLMEKKMERYKFVHVSFDKASENSAGCDNVRKLLASRRRLRKSQLVPAILATWETYQERYLSQTSQRLLPRDPGFLFEVHPRLAESLQTVYVPAGLVNASVPENSTMLAFHLSRVATRLFRALVPLASAEGGQCSVPSALTQQSQRSLVRLRKCLDKDAQSLPSQLQPRASDVLWDGEGREGDEAGFAILAQTAALGLAFAAFKDMLRVDLIWRLNFRFASLANVSADQLFFLYYALDNCELSDRTHRAHEYGAWRRLPAEQRVNLPLRQMAHFAEAFGCEPGRSAMAPMNRCGVLRWPAPRPGLWNDGR
ncbi:neprilysin-1-like [Dermacentor albipictus]|uniref:neprilysin-1-like n=1 Tax=Dermacentor albipictus TaxID=60249 RepID=UPI0038FCDF85